MRGVRNERKVQNCWYHRVYCFNNFTRNIYGVTRCNYHNNICRMYVCVYAVAWIPIRKWVLDYRIDLYSVCVGYSVEADKMMNEYLEGLGEIIDQMEEYDKEILEEISKDMNTIFQTEH